MQTSKISVADIVKSGPSKTAVYKAIRAGKLTFKDSKADPVRLFAEWRSKRDPSRDDKIGPALEKIIRKLGLTVPTPEAKSKQPAAAGEPAIDASGVPQHLSVEMKRFWRRAVSEFELESDALLILRTACEAWDRAQQARVAIAKDGLTVNNRRNPCIDIEAQSQSLFLRAMRQLGLDIEPTGPVGRPVGR